MLNIMRSEDLVEVAMNGNIFCDVMVCIVTDGY
jgi:hypothetical protein